jgi:hypothetical protein
MLVWVEDWEMQCCGDPFAVGSVVEWGLVPHTRDDGDYLAVPLGKAMADAITHCETHHESPDDHPQPVITRARVVSIGAAYWQRTLQGKGLHRALYPAVGTGVVRERQNASGWEPEQEGLHFEGYIVELAPLG